LNIEVRIVGISLAGKHAAKLKLLQQCL